MRPNSEGLLALRDLKGIQRVNRELMRAPIEIVKLGGFQMAEVSWERDEGDKGAMVLMDAWAGLDSKRSLVIGRQKWHYNGITVTVAELTGPLQLEGLVSTWQLCYAQ